MKVYYAHCMAEYGTDQERFDVETLQTLGLEVVNPNSPEVWARCEKTMEKYCDEVRACDALAFRSLPTGHIPAGVGMEIRTAKEAKIPIIELPYTNNRKVLSREDTRAYIDRKRGEGFRG